MKKLISLLFALMLCSGSFAIEPDSLLVRFGLFIDSLDAKTEICSKVEMAKYKYMYECYVKDCNDRKPGFSLEDKRLFTELKNKYRMFVVGNKVGRAGKSIERASKNVGDKMKENLK